jgi:hypothetical protein
MGSGTASWIQVPCLLLAMVLPTLTPKDILALQRADRPAAIESLTPR